MIPWQRAELTVGMPHLVPGQLSEVELMKVLGAYLWEDIAGLVGRPPSEIENEFGERLYASFLCFELSLGQRSLATLGEDSHLTVLHRLGLYATKFAEGLVVFGEGDVGADLPSAATKEDLASLGLPWAYAINGFVTRGESNTRLKLFSPVGIDTTNTEPHERPIGLLEHAAAFSTGIVQDLGSGYTPRALRPTRDEPVEYQVVPESDLNGAGLLYFARYVAIMNYAERTYLRRNFALPFSTHLVRCLSTDHRRTYFFANAEDTDAVLVQVRVAALPHGSFPPGPPLGPLFRVPFKLQIKFDLYRKSDGVLMATSLCRKSLTIPAHLKGLLTEARRVASDWSDGATESSIERTR